MPLVTTAVAHLLIILAIGIIVGVGLNRYGSTWLGRLGVGSRSAGDVTYALVGIAGSFIGFHVGVILELLPTPLALYLLAFVGAMVTVWLWRK